MNFSLPHLGTGTARTPSSLLSFPRLAELPLGPLLAGLAALFWAGNFVAGRALHDSLSPLQLAFGRWSVALLCLLPFAWPRIRAQAGALWAARRLILALALTGVTACNTLIYQGLQSTSATQAVLLNAFTPVMVLIYAVCSGQRQPARGQWLGLVLSLVGVLVLVSQGAPWRLWRSPSVAAMPGCLPAALLGGYTVLMRRLPAGLDPAGAHRCLHAAGLVAADAAGVVGYQSTWPAQRVAVGAGRRAVSGRVSIGGGVSVLQPGDCRAGRRARQRLPHLVPAFGALLSCLLLGETLHPWHVLGIAAVFAGLALGRSSR
ncbi:MAG: DMT family transporter [Rivihabitans pingtungensis]